MGDLPGYGNQNQHLCYLMLQSQAEYNYMLDYVLNTTVYSITNTVTLIHLIGHRQLKFLGHNLRM